MHADLEYKFKMVEKNIETKIQSLKLKLDNIYENLKIRLDQSKQSFEKYTLLFQLQIWCNVFKSIRTASCPQKLKKPRANISPI